MILEVYPDDDGERIGANGNHATVDVRVVDSPAHYLEQHDVGVHFGKEGAHSNVDGGHIPISGDTYQAKDTIKEADYGNTARGWNGETWECRVGGTDEVMAVCLDAGYGVTVASVTAKDVDNLSALCTEVPIENTDDIMRFPYSMDGDSRVTETWAKRAAKRVGMTDLEAFAERFNVEVIPDEDAIDALDIDDPREHDSTEIISTAEAERRDAHFDT